MVRRDTLVVRGSFPVRDSVGGDRSAIRGGGVCREVGRRFTHVRRGG